MNVNSFIEDLIKKGYKLHEDLDSFSFNYEGDNLILLDTSILLNKAGDSYNYVFKKTNPKIVISGFADSLDQLIDQYRKFIGRIKVKKVLR